MIENVSIAGELSYKIPSSISDDEFNKIKEDMRLKGYPEDVWKAHNVNEMIKEFVTEAFGFNAIGSSDISDKKERHCYISGINKTISKNYVEECLNDLIKTNIITNLNIEFTAAEAMEFWKLKGIKDENDIVTSYSEHEGFVVFEDELNESSQGVDKIDTKTLNVYSKAIGDKLYLMASKKKDKDDVSFCLAEVNADNQNININMFEDPTVMIPSQKINIETEKIINFKD